jgi:hypothetical protein
MNQLLLGVVALAGGFVLGADEPAPQKLPTPVIPIPGQPNKVDPEMPYFLVCAKACDDCSRMCETCSSHCSRLLTEGKKEHEVTFRLCQDCAAVCQAAARITAKDGPMSQLICAACADACKRCGDECAKHAADPMMKLCAEECRKCEKVCRDMIKK